MKEFDAFIKSVELRAEKNGMKNYDEVNSFMAGFLSMFLQIQVGRNDELYNEMVSYTKMNDERSRRDEASARV
jgi:hypothetical protein